MTNLELMTILGNVRSEYILDAQQLRSGEAKKAIRKLSRKRLILIAAVISLLLLLVGCAAVLIALQRINLGKTTFPQYGHEGLTVDLVSTSGYVDSVNYQATQEWIDFLTTYDADRSLEQNRDHNGYILPDDYRVYNCYTPQMQEKVDEICEKYGLQLAGPMYFTRESKEVFSAVSIRSMADPTAELMFSLSGGTYYRSGSFNVVGKLNYCFEGRSTPDSILFVYACNHKSVFFPDYVIFHDMESVDSWEYTTKDGTNLILAQSPARGVIVADVGDFFISVTLDFRYSSPNGEVDAHNPCSRTEFEQIAETFAYQILPREPDTQWMRYPNALNSGNTGYNDYFQQWLPGSPGSSAFSPYDQQKFLDLDGDGRDEMLIWNTQTGIVYEVVTMVDGSTVCIYGGGQYGLDDHTAPLYLCEGNILERQFANGASVQGQQLHEYYRIQDQQMVMVESVLYGNDDKWYWSASGGASNIMWKEITEEEYDAILAKYTRIEGEPEEEKPLPDSEKTVLKKEAEERLLLCLKDQYSFYRAEDGMEYTLADFCQQHTEELGFPVSITRYTFVDMDADGVQEAVVDFRYGENEQVMCMVLRYDCGTIYGTEFYHRQLSQIKEDGTFTYSSGGDDDGCARLRWENMEWVTEKVGPIGYGDDLKDVIWYSYPIDLPQEAN